MRSSFAQFGLLLGALFSTAVYAQDGNTTTNTDYEVISAQALSSDEIERKFSLKSHQMVNNWLLLAHTVM